MRLLVLAIVLVGSGCAALTPPPVLLGHGSPRGAAPGTTDIHAGGMASGGVFVPSTFAGGLRVRHQLNHKLALGGQVDGGVANTHEDDDILEGEKGRELDITGGAGRLFAHFHPAGQVGPRIALGLGGGGASTGLRYGTADVSVFFGSNGKIVRFYGGPLLAVSHPFVKGRRVDGDEAPSTVYGVVATGVEFSLGETFTYSLDFSAGGAANGGDGALLVAAGSALGVRIPGS